MGTKMSRGGQRERDRAKSQAKLEKNKPAQGREGNPADRNAADSTALSVKVAKKEAARKVREAAEAAALNSAPKVMRKKIPKIAEPGLDDLLNAGLPGGKKKKK